MLAQRRAEAQIPCHGPDARTSGRRFPDRPFADRDAGDGRPALRAQRDLSVRAYRRRARWAWCSTARWQKPNFDDLLRQLEVAPVPPARRIRLCAGGPVDNATRLRAAHHRLDRRGQPARRTTRLALTASLDVLKAIAAAAARARACWRWAMPAGGRASSMRKSSRTPGCRSRRRDHGVRRRPRHQVAPRARQAEDRPAAAVGDCRTRVAHASTAARAAAEHAERRAVRVVQRHRPRRLASVRPSSNCGS